MSNKIVINGFNPVTQAGVIETAAVAICELEPVQSLLAAIERLTVGDETISGLAKHGKNVLEMVLNDLGCLQECAEKAGVVGKLMPDVVHYG